MLLRASPQLQSHNVFGSMGFPLNQKGNDVKKDDIVTD
jgi:hypothetical protein